MGVEVDFRPGPGRGRSRSAARRRSSGCACPTRARACRSCSRSCARCARARGRERAADRLRGRAVHARLLSRGGRGLAPLRAPEAHALARARDSRARCSSGSPTLTVDYLNAQIEAGAQVGAALRHLGGHARRRATTASGCCRRTRDRRELDRAGAAHPLRERRRACPRRDSSKAAPTCSRSTGASTSPTRRAASARRASLQGNLDPCALAAAAGDDRARCASSRATRRPRAARSLNLGHGCLPETPVEGVRAFTDAVRALGSGDERRVRDRLERIAELLPRYAIDGPRYTSYPTAPGWSEAYGATTSAPISPTTRSRRATGSRSTCTCRSARASATSAPATR